MTLPFVRTLLRSLGTLAQGRATRAEEPIRRPPSPASLGLDEDPIVAALHLGDGGRPRRHRLRLPVDDQPPT